MERDKHYESLPHDSSLRAYPHYEDEKFAEDEVDDDDDDAYLKICQVTSNDECSCSEAAEVYLLFRIAWPVALTILCRMGMVLTDLAFVGHLGTDELAAGSLALVWMNIILTPFQRGAQDAMSTLCSQAWGANNHHLVGIWFQLALVLSLVAMLPVATAWYFTEDVLELVGTSSHISALASQFARYSCLWLWPAMIFSCFNSYMQAQGIVHPSLVVSSVFIGINALLNYFFIYGVGSFTGLGFIGSPIATAVSRTGQVVAMWVYAVHIRGYHKTTWPGWVILNMPICGLESPFACCLPERNRNNSEGRRASEGEYHAHPAPPPNLWPARLSEYLRLSSMNMVSGMLEEWQLQIVAFMAAKLGDVEVATHNSTLEVFFFITSFMYGLSTATNIRIAYHLGANQPQRAKQTLKISLVRLAMPMATVIAVLLVVLRNQVGYIFSTDDHIISMAASLTWLVATGYFLLSIFYTSMAALDAQSRPGIVAISFLIGAWLVSVPLAFVFAFPLHMGLQGLWVALIAGYGVITIMASIAVFRSDWEQLSYEAIKRAELTHSVPSLVSQDASLASSSRLSHTHNQYGSVGSTVDVFGRTTPTIAASSATAYQRLAQRGSSPPSFGNRAPLSPPYHSPHSPRSPTKPLPASPRPLSPRVGRADYHHIGTIAGSPTPLLSLSGELSAMVSVVEDIPPLETPSQRPSRSEGQAAAASEPHL